MRGVFRPLSAALLGVAVLFVTLPVVAVLVRTDPADVLTSPAARQALAVSAATSLVANLVFVVVGTPAAYLLATARFPGRGLLMTLCELPIVLPPAVAGIGLLMAFGREGMLGGPLERLGVSVGFTPLAVVLAVVLVAGPLYVRGAVAAFQAVDGDLLDAARTLGARPGRVFARVAVPVAAGGLGAAWAVAFARGLGEFGATIIVAGSLAGVTQTLPLAVYAQLQVDLDQALAVGTLLILLAAAVLFAVKLVPRWTASTSA